MSKNFQKSVAILILITQVFSAVTPALTFAAPQTVSGTDTKNALETVGTKVNRQKTAGSSGVDESTGAFTYSYPVAFPKGYLGHEPSLTLSYNSQNQDNSIVGYGWNLDFPYIERTARYGVDKIYTKNDFVSSLGGELLLRPGSTNEYIQKIDDGSYQLYKFSNNVWTLTDRSGNTYTFGTTLDSRLSDETGSRIHKYFLTEVRDIMGNKIKYFYEKKNGFVYPKEIIYTIKKDGTYSNKIVFEREQRLDEEVSYRSGFRTTMNDRIKSVKMFTDNVLVGQVDLSYTLGQNGTRSMLASISESRLGTDNILTTIPPTKFEYELGTSLSFQNGSNDREGNAFIDISGDSKPEYVSVTDTSSLYQGATWKPIDINGDYLQDLYFYMKGGPCQGYCTPSTDNGKVKINIGNEFKSSNLPHSYFNLAYTGVVSTMFQSVDYSVSAVDFNGDGLQDISTNGSVMINNNGNSFIANGITGVSDNVEDFNGDGLPDIIKEYSSTTASSTNGLYVFLNTGSGFQSTPEVGFKIPFSLKMKSSANNDTDAGVRFVDINADGMVDIIKSWYSDQIRNNGETKCASSNGPCTPVEYVFSGSQNEVYLNNGNSFVKSTSVNLGDNYAIYYSRGATTWQCWLYVGCDYWWSRPTYTKSFYDSNNDGSVDFGGGISSFKKQDILKKVTNSIGAKSEVTYKGSATGNNPKLPINMLVVDQIKETESLKNLVETTGYQFENGKMYYDAANIYDRRFAGFGKVTTAKGDQKTVKYFHQGDGDDAANFERGDSFHNIGKIYREELFGGTRKYSESFRNYGVYEYAGQVYKYPKQEITISYDDAGNKIAKATAFDYDLAARLPKAITNFGEVNYEPSTGTISDIKEDAVISKNIYNTKRPQKILSEETVDINGKFLDKKIYFYDELPFGYVERGLLTEERNYSNANVYTKNNYVYNELGQIISKKDNNGNAVTYEYDANGNVAKVTNVLGQTATTIVNKWLGVNTKSVDSNGKVIETVYDGFGRIKSVYSTKPDGQVGLVSVKNYTYNSFGFTESENIMNGSEIYKTVSTSFDSFGRPITSSETLGNSIKKVDSEYNNLGQLISVTYPYDSTGILGSLNSSINTIYSYDSLGRMVQIKQGDNTSFVKYNVDAKTVSDNSTSGHVKTYKYNSQDKIIEIHEKNGGSTNVTKYSWNLLGNLTQIIDAENNVRNFVYDSEGRLLKQEDLHKANDNTFGVYTYKYDSLGNLLEKIDPTLNKYNYSYDNLYRPISESVNGRITNYTYDICEKGTGKICKIVNEDYTQEYIYNVLGLTVSENKTIDGKKFETKYAYNNLGQMTTQTLPENSNLIYTYDVNGKQKSVKLISSDGKSTNYVNDAKFNLDGTVNEIAYGNNSKNCYKYSTSNGGVVSPRLSEIYSIVSSDCAAATKENPQNLYYQKLDYNKEGLIIKNTEKYVKDSSDIISSFTYDELNRLTATNVLENNLNKVNNINYSPIGNILASDSTIYNYAGTDYANPHAPTNIGSKNIAYDLNGNVLDDGKNVYEWTEKNTLAKQENDKSISEYTYDISGERIKEVVKKKSSATETSQYSVKNDIIAALAQSSVNNRVDTYVSEKTFLELENAKLTSENKISMLFALAYETGYPQKSCTANANPDCQKIEAQKFVAGYLFQKYNIKLSNTTLEEMYSVFLGKLLVGNSYGDYMGIVSTSTPNTVYFPYNGYISYNNFSPTDIQYLNSNIDLSTVPTNKNFVFSLNFQLNQLRGNGLPVEIFVDGKLVTSSTGNYTMQNLDITREVNYARSQGKTSINLVISPATTNTDFYGAVNFYTLSFKYNQFTPTNKINPIANVIPALTSTQINNEIINKNNKELYSYIYRENKIPSLFGSTKLISKEAFADLQNLGITYTNLVIYDRLVSYSMNPYASCDTLSGELKENCTKTILVKYLYAIIKYEKGVEVSVHTLDEMVSVIQGDLSVPNNLLEFSVIENKIYSLQTSEVVNYFTVWGNNGVNVGNNYNYQSSCNVGNHYSGTSQNYISCDLQLNLPQELLNRRLEIEKVTTTVKTAQGRQSAYSTTFTPGDIYAYPLVSNGPVTWYGNQNETSNYYNWNTNSQYGTPAASVVLGTDTQLDITKIVQGIANNWFKNFGMRMFSSGDNIYIQNGGKYELAVTYKKDADQQMRALLTPLVTNPKDVDVYQNVLNVLARIDKEYSTANGMVISGQTFEEIKLTNATTTETISSIFEQNEKLQKDDTLAAVWQDFKVNKSKELSREALEELFMVWKGQLVVASSSFYTSSSTNPVFTRSTLTNLSVVPGVTSERSLINDIPFPTKLAMSKETYAEIKSLGVSDDAELKNYLQGLGVDTNTKIPKDLKIAALTNINNKIVETKNVKLSREALEEIYYFLNGYLSATTTTSTAIVPTMQPISHYKFDGLIGTDQKKKDEYQNIPAQERGATSVNGRKNAADSAYFTTNNTFVKGYAASPLADKPATYSMWIKTTESGTKSIFGFNAIGPRTFFTIWIIGGKISPELAWPGYGMGVTGNKIVNDDKWHKIDVTLENNPNATMKIYVDGVLDAQTTFTTSYNAQATNDTFIGAFQNYSNGAMVHYFTGSIDDVRTYNTALSSANIKTLYDEDLTNVLLVPTYGNFDRSKLGVLEPVQNVVSKNEEKLTDNIGYSINSDFVKIVSEDSRGELSLANIKNRQQILDIMQKTPVILKDSKIHYFKEYVKQMSGIDLSREALEEVYLIYSEKEIFPDVVATTTLTESNIYPFIQYKNSVLGVQGANCMIGTTAEYTYPVYSCTTEINIKPKYGYKISSANMTLDGEIMNNSYSYIKTEVVIKDSKEIAQKITDLTKYFSMSDNRKYKISYSNNSGSLNNTMNLKSVTVDTVYEPVTTQMDRSSFGSLENISSFDDLKKSYEKEVAELNAPVSITNSATSSIYFVSTSTKNELVTLGATTTEAVKNLFVNASSTQSKESQLYSIYLFARTKNITLSRLALEEIWNVKIGKEVMPVENVAPAIIPVTITETKNVLSVNSAYIWTNGVTYTDANMCYSMGAVDTHCYFDFGDLKKAGFFVQKAEITSTYYNENNPGHYNIYFAIPNENTNPLRRVNITVDNTAKFTTSGVKGVQPLTTVDVTNLIKSHLGKTTQTDTDLVLTHLGSEPVSNWTKWHYTRAEGWNGIYGLKNPTLTITYSNIDTPVASTPVLSYPTFDGNSIINDLIISSISTLEDKYNTENNLISTSTQISTPTFCNSLLEDCIQEIYTTTTTTTLVDNTSTTIVDTTPVCNISNPYAYPYMVNENCFAIFILPDGSTTTNSTIKIYNTIASNLSNNTEEIYTRYFPSPNYEYDNRGIHTINVTFNGKVVGTYRYNDIHTLSEISFIHNNYQGTPSILMDMATVTQVIKRDVWGNVNSNSYVTDEVIPTSIGYTGHKYDMDSNLTYAHARFLNNQNKLWLSSDPMSVNRFSSEVFIFNPQIQNSYSYARNNPVMNIDPDGQEPTALEAAYGSQHIYTGKVGDVINGSWRLGEIVRGGNDLVMGVYSRGEASTGMEYMFAYKGTSKLINWYDNLAQPFGKSPDARSIFGQDIDAIYKDICSAAGSDCTSVGHSKAGAEASLAGVNYNTDVMTFNSARANYFAYGLSGQLEKYTKEIKNYIVRNESIDANIGFLPLIGKTVYLNGAAAMPKIPNPNGLISISSVNFVLKQAVGLNNHSMETVLKSLNKTGSK